MKKRQCSVCNYIHEGDEPPMKCPVCGAEKEKFIEITGETSEETDAREDQGENAPSMLEKITTLVVAKHLHPISVHGPNGIIPMAVLFLTCAVFFQLSAFESAAYFSMVFVLLNMPLVLLSGYLTWQKKYNGANTSLFKMKIIASSVATVILGGLILWKILQPDVLSNASLDRFIFLFWAVVMLAAIGLAGHLGGQLVFASKK